MNVVDVLNAITARGGRIFAEGDKLKVTSDILSSDLETAIREKKEYLISFLQAPISNDDEYQEVLERIIKGAEFIEGETFKMLPLATQRKAHERYDNLVRRVMVYRGVI